MATLIGTNWQGSEEQSDLGACWCWQSGSSLEEALPVIEFVAQAMAEEAYPDHDIFEMRLALREALTNAVRHGNQGDASRLLDVRYQVDAERVLVEVEDQGDGFAVEELADLCRGPNPEHPGGGGLWVMRSCVTWVRYNDRGNRATLCKYRSVL